MRVWWSLNELEPFTLYDFTHGPKRRALRARLIAGRLTCPLFDTARYTRDFEAALERMVGRHEHRDGTAACSVCVRPGRRELRDPCAPPSRAQEPAASIVE